MEKKRSLGVTIFAWLFIIGGIMGLLRFGSGLLGLGSCPKVSPESGEGLPTGICPLVSRDFNFYLNYYWSKFSPLIGLIGGIFLLKLKQWARKLILLLSCLSLVMAVVGFKTYNKQRDTFDDMMSKSMQTVYEQQRQEIIEKYKPEHQEEALKQHSKTMEVMQRAPGVFYKIFYSMTICFMLWNVCVIFFFTRPKVKEQFRETGDGELGTELGTFPKELGTFPKGPP